MLRRHKKVSASQSERDFVNAINAENIQRLSSGTFHNIGNVITIAKLSLESMRELNGDEMLDIILEEILPTLRQHCDEGSVQNFLTDDPKGREYIGALIELITHQKENLRKQRDLIAAMDAKLKHIGDIVALQQRIVGGTGAPKEVSLKSIAEDALQMIAESTRRHNIELEQHFLASPPVFADPSALAQVVINLLKNAIEAMDEMPEQERKIVVSTGVRDHDGKQMAYCDVSDTGPGIDEDAAKRVFDFGYTTKRSTINGNGIGLYFCQLTVEKFGGHVTVYKNESGGATFTVLMKPVQA